DYSPLKSFTTLAQKVSVVDAPTDASLVTYPNPAGLEFPVDFSIGYSTDANYTLEVKNLIGQNVLVQQGALNNGGFTQNVSLDNQITNGAYFVIVTVDGKQFRQQLIINR